MSVRHARLALGVVTAVLSATLLAGCGDGSSSETATQPMSSMSSMSSMSMSPGDDMSGATTAQATIMIKDFAFSGPAPVAPGAMITVTNDDSEAHSVTADGAGGFDVNVAPGTSQTFTAPSKAGSYPFHCMFHSTMHGTLEVK
jgi:plastocyanin